VQEPIVKVFTKDHLPVATKLVRRAFLLLFFPLGREQETAIAKVRK